VLEGVLTLQPDNGVVVGLAEFALCSVLYRWHEDGFTDLRSAWRLPGRALVLGMPLTFAVTAALAHSIAGLSWTEAMLVGAVLAPTDPVFASAIVGRQEVPARLRSLLNVESGLNDGLALPVILVLLSVLAFSAGITVASLAPDVEASFSEFGEVVTELLKLAAILVFGALISPAFSLARSHLCHVFKVLALVVARPLAITVSLLRSRLPLPQRAVAAWFGPKRFASVVYGLSPRLRAGRGAAPDRGARRCFQPGRGVSRDAIGAHSRRPAARLPAAFRLNTQITPSVALDADCRQNHRDHGHGGSGRPVRRCVWHSSKVSERGQLAHPWWCTGGARYHSQHEAADGRQCADGDDGSGCPSQSQCRRTHAQQRDRQDVPRSQQCLGQGQVGVDDRCSQPRRHAGDARESEYSAQCGGGLDCQVP